MTTRQGRSTRCRSCRASPRGMLLTHKIPSRKVKGGAQRFGCGGDACPRGGRHFFGGSVRFADHDPDSGVVDAIVRADRAGGLRDFEVMAREFAFEERAGFVEQVFESLGRQYGIDVARYWSVDLQEVEILERPRDRQFD